MQGCHASGDYMDGTKCDMELMDLPCGHVERAGLIGATTTSTGLRIKAAVDRNHYQKGIKVSDEELASLNVQPHRFHGDWNYTIRPSPV